MFLKQHVNWLKLLFIHFHLCNKSKSLKIFNLWINSITDINFNICDISATYKSIFMRSRLIKKWAYHSLCVWCLTHVYLRRYLTFLKIWLFLCASSDIAHVLSHTCLIYHINFKHNNYERKQFSHFSSYFFKSEHVSMFSCKNEGGS